MFKATLRGMPKKIQYSGLFLSIIRGRCVVAASQSHSYSTVFLTIVALQPFRTSTGLTTRMVLTLTSLLPGTELYLSTSASLNMYSKQRHNSSDPENKMLVKVSAVCAPGAARVCHIGHFISLSYDILTSQTCHHSEPHGEIDLLSADVAFI